MKSARSRQTDRRREYHCRSAALAHVLPPQVDLGEKHNHSPVAGNLPLENGAPFGRFFGFFLFKDIDFMPEGVFE
jgi:hypothetical protein